MTEVFAPYQNSCKMAAWRCDSLQALGVDFAVQNEITRPERVRPPLTGGHGGSKPFRDESQNKTGESPDLFGLAPPAK